MSHVWIFLWNCAAKCREQWSWVTVMARNNAQHHRGAHYCGHSWNEYNYRGWQCTIPLSGPLLSTQFKWVQLLWAIVHNTIVGPTIVDTVHMSVNVVSVPILEGWVVVVFWGDLRVGPTSAVDHFNPMSDISYGISSLCLCIYS